VPEKYRIGSAQGNIQIGDGNEMWVSAPAGASPSADVDAAVAELARRVAVGQEALRAIEADLAELREELARPQPRQARVGRLVRALGSRAADVGAIEGAVTGVQRVIEQA
jgi:hypothetical protein